MKEVSKLVLHYDLEDLVKFQTSEIKSMFEIYSQAVKDGCEEDFDCEISMSEDDLEKKFETDINLN